LLNFCNQVGISTDSFLRSSVHSTAVYNAILDSTGELHVAIADMEIFSLISPSFITQFKEKVNQAQIVFVDANVPQDTIIRLTEIIGDDNKLWFEPTSVPKSIKVATSSILHKIHYISPNKFELAAIANALDPTIELTATDIKACKENIRTLLNAGVQNVIVKMGADGVLVGSRNFISGTDEIIDGIHYHHYAPLQPEKIVSVTGAGDSLAGATIFALLQGKSLDESVRFGLLSAKLSLESDSAVSPMVSTATWTTFEW